MRKFILIAGFVLASAAAQAGDRSLSLGGGETTKVSAPAKAIEGPRTAEAPQAAEAPKYVERPAAVEPKPETQGRDDRDRGGRSETSRAAAGNTARARHQGGRHAAVRQSPRERRAGGSRRPGELR